MSTTSEAYKQPGRSVADGARLGRVAVELHPACPGIDADDGGDVELGRVRAQELADVGEHRRRHKLPDRGHKVRLRRHEHLRWHIAAFATPTGKLIPFRYHGLAVAEQPIRMDAFFLRKPLGLRRARNSTALRATICHRPGPRGSAHLVAVRAERSEARQLAHVPLQEALREGLHHRRGDQPREDHLSPVHPRFCGECTQQTP